VLKKLAYYVTDEYVQLTQDNSETGSGPLYETNSHETDIIYILVTGEPSLKEKEAIRHYFKGPFPSQSTS